MSTSTQMVVNGVRRTLDAEPECVLVDLLRDSLHLTGSHVGCATGDCGACSVVLDGAVVKSCLLLCGGLDGADVSTIEGLSDNCELTVLQKAFWDEDAVQCGFCAPGMLLCAWELLRSNVSPTESDIRRAIGGNICRSTGSDSIVRATQARAAELGKADQGSVV